MTETENQAAVAVAAAEEGRKVKFLCSFGGSILPRPSDGKLRYAGGETRIVSVGRDVGYRDLMVKMKEFCEQEALTLKYQQPDDDLDALVSVLSDEDVCHMMEEYDRLEAGDGLSGRLRLFLFAAGEHQLLQEEHQKKLPSGEGNDEQRYVKALNSVTEISRQQSDNKNNEIMIKNNVSNGGDLNSSSTNINSNGNSNSNSLLVGNGSETGMAQHVSVALPVSLMKPFPKGVGGLASSPPSSPSHHRAAPHHQQVSATSDQYHGRHSNISQYVYNSNSGQPEPSCDVQGQSQQNLCHSDVQGHEYGPLGQSEHSSHHHYPSIHSMPRPESFQNIQGMEVPPKGQPEHGSQYHHYHHHQECPPHRQESYRLDATVPLVEIPSKGKEEVDGHPLHLAHRVEPYQEIPAAPVVEFPIKGQSEAGSYNQLLPRPHELQQDVAAVSRVEIALNLQAEVGSYQQHLPRLQSDAGNHPQHVVTNITPPRSPQPSQPNTYWKTPGQPGVEYSHGRQRSVGSGIHSGFVGIREEYKQGVVDPFVTHVESHGNLQPLEAQHVNAHSEVAVNVANRDDGKLDSIQSHQCSLNCPTCSRQKDMPVVHHQAAQNSSIEIHCDQECKSSNYYGELSSSNSVQRGTSRYPLCGQSEQVKHIQNDNGLYQGSFSDQEYMYGDHRELVHSNMLQNNAYLHSMVEQVEHRISENDIEIERSWNAPPYYASEPQLPHEFSCIPPSADVMDFHLASTSTAHEVSLGSAHERYVGNHHYVQVPWAFDEYGNRVDYMSSRLRENLGPLNYHPSSNNYLAGDNHVGWHGQPHLAEKDTRFQGQNLSHLQNTFEGNHLSQWQYAGLQSRQNVSEVWVPHLYSEQLLPYSDQYAPDKVNFQNVKEFGQYCPLVSEELSLKVLSTRVDQSKYPGQLPDERVGFHNGQEKQKERVLSDMNDQSEKVRMLRDAKAHGGQALREGIPNTFGQNNPWDHYPRHYEGLHSDDAYYRTEADDFNKHVISDLYEPQIHKALPAESGAGHGKFMDMLGNALQSKVKHMVIETPTDCTSGIHWEPNNVQKDEYHKGGENGCAGSVLYKRYDQDFQRMEHECKSHEMNTLHVTDFPDYMPTDIFQNNANTSYSDSHCLKSSHFTRETGDIKFPTIDPVNMHTSFQSETGMACIPDALSTVENNQIPSSGAFLHAVNFTAALLLDKLTIPGSSIVSPSVSSSSPQRSDNITSTTPPIYDKTPANSLSAALPENFWSGIEKGSKLCELNENSITENKRMMSTTTQVAAEHGPNDLQTPKQYEEAVDSGMHRDHLNGKVDDSCISRPMDLPLHGPSIPSSSTTLTSKILDEQNSVGNEKEVVTGMVDKEVKDEDMLSTSDVEENIPQQEATENNPSGLDEDINSGLVDMARSAEAQALAKGLQTIRNADLEEIRELGSGTYGTVYYGKWKGSDVAIKRIKSSCFEGRPAEHERLIADFWREATILSQLHHPNVVSFYGVVQDGPGTTLSTVTEFMVNGSLKQVLRKKDRTIDRRKRLILAMDAAFGMEYLHAKNIVHFDLKCENLLVNMRDPHRPICKIGDMGLSKVKHKTLVSGGVRGTLPWMAPELLSGKGGVSDKIDVYSFGIVMWELLTGDEPYSNMHCGSIIGGIMKNTLRPPVPDWCDPAWRSLMERCWSAKPEERPPFSEISKELRAVAASMNVK